MIGKGAIEGIFCFSFIHATKNYTFDNIQHAFQLYSIETNFDTNLKSNDAYYYYMQSICVDNIANVNMISLSAVQIKHRLKIVFFPLSTSHSQRDKMPPKTRCKYHPFPFQKFSSMHRMPMNEIQWNHQQENRFQCFVQDSFNIQFIFSWKFLIKTYFYLFKFVSNSYSY